MVDSQALEAALQKDPFEPFRIVTTSGKSYDITERDVRNIMLFKKYVFIGLRARAEDVFFTGHDDVAYDSIDRLAPIRRASSAT